MTRRKKTPAQEITAGAVAASLAIELARHLGERVDALHDLRQRRLAAQRAVDELQAEETAATGELLEALRGSDLTAARGQRALASVGHRVVPHVQDAAVFFAHVAKTREFDLLIRQVNAEAFRARAESGRVVPGVEPVTLTKLSITKSKP